MTVTCRVEKITPAIAKEWLGNNTNNFRQLSQGRVEQYAQEMSDGNWDLNGESIIFQEDGSLSNGQHRLHAVISSEVAIQSMVVRGIKTKSLHVDRGKPRTIAQWLVHEGIKNAGLVAAASRLCIAHDKDLWTMPSWGAGYITDSEIVDFASAHCLQLVPTTSFFRVEGISASTMAALLFIGSGRKDASLNDTAVWFRNALVSGNDLQDTDAVLHLRNRLRRPGHDQLPPFMVRMMVTLAWNKTAGGIECTKHELRLRLAGPYKQSLPDKIVVADIDDENGIG